MIHARGKVRIISEQEKQRGYIIRFFAKDIHRGKIVEVLEPNLPQYNIPSKYFVISLVWTISGSPSDLTAPDGSIIRGAEYKNAQVIEYYESRMSGLSILLRDPLEYFIGNLTPS
jgi:hypothetical protein